MWPAGLEASVARLDAMGENRSNELNQGRLPGLHSLQSQELFRAAGSREGTPALQSLSGESWSYIQALAAFKAGEKVQDLNCFHVAAVIKAVVIKVPEAFTLNERHLKLMRIYSISSVWIELITR